MSGKATLTMQSSGTTRVPSPITARPAYALRLIAPLPFVAASLSGVAGLEQGGEPP